MIKNSEVKKTIHQISAFLVEQLMKIKNCSRDEALEFLMQMSVYTVLMDPETELFLESRESILDILKNELNGNYEKLLEV